MNRLQNIFTNAVHPLFVADVCGAPDMVQSEKRIQTLIDNSVEIINLIVPFSDPMADGAAVQSAAQQALANGADLEKVLQMIARIRKNNPAAGLVISGYYNVFPSRIAEKHSGQIPNCIGSDIHSDIQLLFIGQGSVFP